MTEAQGSGLAQRILAGLVALPLTAYALLVASEQARSGQSCFGGCFILRTRLYSVFITDFTTGALAHGEIVTFLYLLCLFVAQTLLSNCRTSDQYRGGINKV